MSKKELEREVLKILKEKGELMFEELATHMKVDKLLLREVIASMIREGIILKVPDFERGKFVYRPA
ncbi:MAG: hypothetical protein DRO23_10980 [Thermoprotei archaeon]|nr:MAG: hypothetical protein DRO23_10980 [Thermoprotei archaeon]